MREHPEFKGIPLFHVTELEKLVKVVKPRHLRSNLFRQLLPYVEPHSAALTLTRIVFSDA